MRRNQFRGIATVRLHLNGGFTRVAWHTGHEFDIPTEQIPVHLRSLGTRFTLSFKGLWPEAGDSIQQIRQALSEPVTIEELKT